MEPGFLELPDFEIVSQIGKGTTSQVFRAIRRSTNANVALKVIPTTLFSRDSSATIRIEREVAALSTLRHPNIVRLYGVHKTKQNFIFEMEFVDGVTLAQWMQNKPSALIEPKLWILAQLAQALAVAHLDGTIHRDLKPENILISNFGEVKLSDFGLAKQTNQVDMQVTQPGVLLGSLAYMAPESLNEGKSTFASDIFSFGVIAYELLSGTHPFPHADIKTLVENVCTENKNHLSLPFLDQRAEFVILKCLHRNASERPTSFWEIFAELMVVLQTSHLKDSYKALLRQDSKQVSRLEEAFKKKQAALSSEIEKELKNRGSNSKHLLRLFNEFSVLFPLDEQVPLYLQRLAPKRKLLSRLLLLAGLTAGIVFGISVYFFKSPKVEPVTQTALPVEDVSTKDQVKEPNTVMLPPSAPVVPVAPPETKVAATVPVASFGTLSMYLDSGTKVFINGIRQSSASLQMKKLKVGLHHILVERDGFLPIERTITIKKDSITKIRTSEEQDNE